MSQTCTFHPAITNRRLNYIQQAHNHNQSSKHNHHSRCQRSLTVMVFANRRSYIRTDRRHLAKLPSHYTKHKHSNTFITQSNLLHQTSLLLQPIYTSPLAGRPSTSSHQISYLYSPLPVYITRPNNSLSLHENNNKLPKDRLDII